MWCILHETNLITFQMLHIYNKINAEANDWSEYTSPKKFWYLKIVPILFAAVSAFLAGFLSGWTRRAHER